MPTAPTSTKTAPEKLSQRGNSILREVHQNSCVSRRRSPAQSYRGTARRIKVGHRPQRPLNVAAGARGQMLAGSIRHLFPLGREVSNFVQQACGNIGVSCCIRKLMKAPSPACGPTHDRTGIGSTGELSLRRQLSPADQCDERRPKERLSPDLTSGIGTMAQASSSQRPAASNPTSGGPSNRLMPRTLQMLHDLGQGHRVQDPIRWHAALAGHLDAPMHVVELAN